MLQNSHTIYCNNVTIHCLGISRILTGDLCPLMYLSIQVSLSIKKFTKNALTLTTQKSPLAVSLKGQCPDYAHARASSVFSSKDNRTVILTPQDFLPDRTADGDLLFIFSSNILDFRRSLSSYLKFGSRHEDSSRFYR